MNGHRPHVSTWPAVSRVIPAGLRLGPTYWRWRRAISQTERRPPRYWPAYQARALREVLRFARETVPFYRTRIPQAVDSVTEQDVFRLMEDIPVLSKSDVTTNFEKLWSDAVPSWKRRVLTTGGSTGAPVRFGLERRASFVEWAFITSIWARVGFRVGDRRLVVRGLPLGGSILRERPVLDELQLSAFHLSATYLNGVWPRVESYRPRFLHGYPSALVALLLWDEEAVRRLGPRAVFCGSEPLLPWQRDLLTDKLRVPIAHWYGQSERVLLGGDCRATQAFHLFPQYGYAEIVNPTTLALEAEGTLGELIGTGFISRAMPLIRYRTEDWGVIQSGTECQCGRGYPLLTDIRPHRPQEFLIGGTGTAISMTAINFHDESLIGIAGLQFVQDQPGSATLLLLSPSNLETQTVERIHRALSSKVADELRVEVRQTERLTSLPSGKVPLIIQRSAVSDPGLRRLLSSDGGLGE
jgi:phenylacetate-CoA ligase